MITPGEVELIASGLSGIVGYVAGVSAGRKAGRIQGRREGYELAVEWDAPAPERLPLDPDDPAYEDDDDDDPGDPDDPDAELAATQAWLAEIGDDTRIEFERVAAIPDHYAADPGRAHVLQAAEVIRWSALVQDWIEGSREEVMAPGNALYEEAMAEMAGHLERMAAR